MRSTPKQTDARILVLPQASTPPIPSPAVVMDADPVDRPLPDISEAVRNVREGLGGEGLRKVAAFRADHWQRRADGADDPATRRTLAALSAAWRQVAES